MTMSDHLQEGVTKKVLTPECRCQDWHYRINAAIRCPGPVISGLQCRCWREETYQANQNSEIGKTGSEDSAMIPHVTLTRRIYHSPIAATFPIWTRASGTFLPPLALILRW